MSNIRVLPEILANQIAAGEVIERPASVVKELVENSLDAGASRIQVQLEGDGTRLIRIIDDGSGMDEDDVLLSLERHATSKIKSAEELQGIRTLGFRGEALPSIASVAKLIITSRVRTAALGTRAEIHFGRIIKVHDCGCSIGTTFEVRDLFGNMPARKKFVRAARTELFHVEEIIKNCALAYQAVGFSFAVDGSPVLDLPAGDSSPAGRARRFYCRHTREQLIEVNSGGDEVAGEKNVQVYGFLVPPDLAAAGSSRLRFFVNGRAVKDRLMSQAVSEGLQGFIMKSSRPSGVFFVKVPPEMVDVNVHPTKQEVRFRRPSDVQSVLATAVRKAMGSYQGLLKYQLFGEPQGKGDHDRACREFPAAPGSAPFFPEKLETREPDSLYEKRAQTDLPWLASGETSRATAEYFASPGVHAKSHGAVGSVRPPWPGAVDFPDTDAFREYRSADEKNLRTEGEPLRFIGQLLETYILCENEEGLLAIDQHAAHERLLFESLRKQFDGTCIPSQNLLFPAVVECTPETLRLLYEHHDHLTRLGLSLQEFGGASCLIKAVPAILSHLPPSEIVGEIVDHLEKAGSAKELSLAMLNAILSSMACKAAIKAGQKLAPPEAEALLRQLAGADIFSHCPHGRPVTKQFSSSEIKRWFHRG